METEDRDWLVQINSPTTREFGFSLLFVAVLATALGLASGNGFDAVSASVGVAFGAMWIPFRKQIDITPRGLSTRSWWEVAVGRLGTIRAFGPESKLTRGWDGWWYGLRLTGPEPARLFKFARNQGLLIDTCGRAGVELEGIVAVPRRPSVRRRVAGGILALELVAVAVAFLVSRGAPAGDRGIVVIVTGIFFARE